MERTRLSSLLVIALLQLSQTDVSSTLPESWYAANVVRDGAYMPKPLSENFPTETTFSPPNPIVVRPKLTYTPGAAMPTYTFGTTTERPVNEIEVSVVPLSTKQPPPPWPQPAFRVSPQPPSVSTVTYTTQPPLPPLPPHPPQFPQMPQFQQPPPPPFPPPIVFIPQGIQIQTASQGSPQLTQLQHDEPHYNQPHYNQPHHNQPHHNQPPNYFLLYQQLSQNVQNTPANPTQLPSSSLPPFITSTTLPTSTVITSTTLPTSTSTITTSTTLPTSTRSVTTSTTSPTSTRSVLTSTTFPTSSFTTQAPCPPNTTSVPLASIQFPTFQIRMVAPSGSMTNFRIDANPTAATTTTRRPTTTRIRRKNRNNYDGCVNECGGTRVPICASPLGVSPINPDTLKGFPSVCHMACNNSFRKNLFQKVMDGKCSKLRTRIRPFDTNDKLKRNELNRASYTIVQDGAFVEFSPLTT